MKMQLDCLQLTCQLPTRWSPISWRFDRMAVRSTYVTRYHRRIRHKKGRLNGWWHCILH